MKKITPLSIIILILFLTTACSSSTPTATQVSIQEPTQPAATEAPSSQPTAEASPVAATTQVDITLADNTIESSLATFKVGVPYTFVIKNTGRHAHDFNISTPVSIAGSIDAAQASALLVVSRDQLPVGANVSVQYTFPASAAGQQLEFSCLIKKHYEDGMKLAITVTK